MQEDAIRRVREMQRRSQEKIAQTERMFRQAQADPSSEPNRRPQAASKQLETTRQQAGQQPPTRYEPMHIGGGQHHAQTPSSHSDKDEGQHRHAEDYQSSHREKPSSPQAEKPIPDAKDRTPPHREQSRKKPLLGFGGENFISGLLDSINIDHDQALLLALILLLANEGADPKLLLALCYLMI